MNKIMNNLLLFALFPAGCGGGYSPPAATPGAQNASISGQYNLVLTSANSHGTTNIYADFTQTGKTFTGAAKTFVCPANDLSQCQGDDAQVVSITAGGTVSGENVTMKISFPSATGADTVTLAGTATQTNLAGTYTDTLGDSGTWTAFTVGSLSGTYTGTFNSTSHPFLVAPNISLVLAQDSAFNLTATVTITGSPCMGSLSLSGQAIGEAFTLADSARKAHILALPTGNHDFIFSYNFDPSAASCAGDVGRGTITTTQSPWDYYRTHQ
jgi:hypothetical protein